MCFDSGKILFFLKKKEKLITKLSYQKYPSNLIQNQKIIVSEIILFLNISCKDIKSHTGELMKTQLSLSDSRQCPWKESHSSVVCPKVSRLWVSEQQHAHVHASNPHEI